MQSLSDKLKELGVQVGPANLKTNPKSPSSPQLVDFLPGSWENTSRGDCFVVRKNLPHSHIHGVRKLSQIPILDIFEALQLFKGISDIPLSQYLFIDTETTGLSGGAGTYVFLIGVAKYDEEGLDFAQFFLQDPANESSQLAALEEFSANTKLLISYNGKSFDLPRIRSRYLLHGWPAPFENIYHLDLLHIVRRLWKQHLPGCSLGDVENHLLGIKRSSIDIPGWQVAEIFFNYLQDGDPSSLESVFYHNEVDVISLVTLLSYITHRLSKPLSRVYSKSEDLITIGHYLSTINHSSMAIRVLSKALQIDHLSVNQKISAMSDLASLHKKTGAYEKSVPLWEACAALKDIQSSIELAMYYEHRKLDYQEAIHWTLSAFEMTQISPTPGKISEIKSSLKQRLNRLKNKAS